MFDIRYETIPSGAIAVVAQVSAKAGKEQELRLATLPLVSQVRNEHDNILYFLHEDHEQPGHFVFYEIFASREAFEAHNRTEHVQSWFKLLPDLAEGGVEVMQLTILGQ
ncbi:putative quinol monooxygenase [Agrobacterium sp. SOY23]|uniref:putative quinol monooxygenase n=1 Tax=Agrobacterium sp. SOY23 TaxID=3014555 RepID=UPI0022AF78CD|nr:putative quinol monooxygenase [Agrobacterium sp. SOY23]MCZ4431291.1 putative quinol monooxygenase [Agrobacterium sp. SOY23]